MFTIRPNTEHPDWPTLQSLGLTLPKDQEGKERVLKALHKAQEDALRSLRKGSNSNSNSMGWLHFVSDLRKSKYEEELLEDGTLRVTIPWVCQDFFDGPEQQHVSVTVRYGPWQHSPQYAVRYAYLSFSRSKDGN